MSVRKWILTSAAFVLALGALPRTASADWTLTPFVGWNFKGSADLNGTGGTFIDNKFEQKLDYGVSLASMGAGVVGFEIDFGYSPNFFATDTATNNDFKFTNNSNVTTLTGNAIVGIPIGGQRGGSVRPYVVGGVGLIRSKVQDVTELFDVNTKNDFGYDIGAGVMGFFTTNIGLRGDVRYFRSFNGSEDNIAGIGVSDFKFWRGSVGVSFKF